MTSIVEAREPDDAAARVGAPVWGVEPGKRRHEIDAAVIGNGVGKRFDVARVFDNAELVAQPLDGGTRHGYRTFEGINRRSTTKLIANGGQQSCVRRHDIRPCIEQHEVARAISVLGFAGQKANLPDGRGLLIAEVCAQRNFAFEGAARLSQAIEVCIRRRANGRQHRTWNVKEPEQFIIPIKSLEIEEHCAAGIRHIRDVRSTLYATAQVPDKPRVDIAEDRLTSTSGSARAVDTLEDPL